MGRRQQPYTLERRARPESKRIVWYYTINPESGVPAALCEKRRSTGKSTRTAAVQFVLRRIDSLREEAGREADLEELGPTVGSYLEPFYDPARCPHMTRIGPDRVGVNTAKIQRGNLKRHVMTDPITERRIAEVTPADLAALRGRLLAKGLAQATVAKIMNAVRVAFHEALINRVIDHDPAVAVPRISPESAEKAVFTREQLRALFAERPGCFLSMEAWIAFRLAAVMGMRRGEVLALRWGDVDETRQTLLIRRAWRSETELGLPKGGRAREVLAPAWLLEELASYREDRVRIGEDDLVVCSEVTGRRKGQKWWNRNWHHARKAAGIPETDARERAYAAHGLRHTVDTMLLEARVNPIVVGGFLGHETHSRQRLTGTQRIYTHVEAMDPREVIRVLDDVFVGANQNPA